MIQALAFLGGSAFAQATIANFLFFFALNTFVLLPLHILQLGGTEAEIGLIQAMYSATGIVCQPVIGQWVDRIGRRFFMLVGAALVAVTSAVFAFTASIPVLAVLRGLHGIGFSAFFVANYVHVVDLVPAERRGWALGIFGVSGLLATALAPLAGEFVLRALGFPALFVGAMLCAGAAVAVLARMRGIRPPAMGGHRTHLLRLGARELFRMHMAVAWFFGLGTGVIFTFLPTFGELLGVRGVGLFYTAYAAAAILVRVAGGELIDTIGRRPVIIPSMAVQAAAAGILALARPRHRADWPDARPAVPLPRRPHGGRGARIPLPGAVGPPRRRDARAASGERGRDLQFRLPGRQRPRRPRVRLRGASLRLPDDVGAPERCARHRLRGELQAGPGNAAAAPAAAFRPRARGRRSVAPRGEPRLTWPEPRPILLASAGSAASRGGQRCMARAGRGEAGAWRLG